MSIVAAALTLGLIVVLLIKWKIVRVFPALVCVLFGLVLAVTPIGRGLFHLVTTVGQFGAAQIGQL